MGSSGSRPGTGMGGALPQQATTGGGGGGTKRPSAKDKDQEKEKPSKEKSTLEKSGGKGKKDDDKGKGKDSSRDNAQNKDSVSGANSQSGMPANYIFSERDPTPEEVQAVVKLQKCQRGYASRRVIKAKQPGNEHHEKAGNALTRMAELMQPHVATVASNMFKTMFAEDPELIKHYPFYEDEWNRITFNDYAGSFPEQLPNTWFILFRDIFFVRQPNYVVPRLTCSLAPAFLRIVDNDTGEEMERVFCRVAPHNYLPNKRGYTVLGEARSGETGNSPAGKWKLRMIGSHAAMPQPVHPDLVSSFCIREIRDYFVPNPQKTIFRYTVRVLQQHITTLYASVNEPNAEICLQIFDKDQLVHKSQGRGATLIPAFIFMPDIENPAEPEEIAQPTPQPQTTTATGKTLGKSGSTVSNMSGRPNSRGPVTNRTPSPKNTKGSNPNSRTLSPMASEVITHKWIVQCVLVNRESWNFGPELEPWFEQQREQAKQETKMSYERYE